MSPPWVLIDVSYLAYRALYAVGHLEWDSSPTGVIFGLFSQLKQICQDPKINSNRVGLFFDSRHSYRRDVFAGYKKKRHDKRTDEQKEIISLLWTQVHVMRKTAFKDIGIPCYMQKGCESDDLLMQASRQIREQGQRSIIVTGDGDLYQAISRSCHWFDPQRSLYYDRHSFEIEKGVPPGLWGKVKTIAGCKSDEVPGVKGVGETTAVKFLLGTLPHAYSAHKKIISSAGQQVIKANRELVVLPHPKTRPVALREPSYNVEAFFKVCKRYGLQSFLMKPQRNAWSNFFRREGVGSLLRRRGEKRGRG